MRNLIFLSLIFALQFLNGTEFVYAKEISLQKNEKISLAIFNKGKKFGHINNDLSQKISEILLENPRFILLDRNFGIEFLFEDFMRGESYGLDADFFIIFELENFIWRNSHFRNGEISLKYKLINAKTRQILFIKNAKVELDLDDDYALERGVDEIADEISYEIGQFLRL